MKICQQLRASSAASRGLVVDLQRVFGQPANPQFLLPDGLHPSFTGRKAIVKAVVERLTS